ncbi:MULTISPECIES: flagellar basal body-associated protein FliL [unclassified Xanthobacter]|uniref:flagellar basal body-associated FliL family protein n=1 Tax=unclassified Xanthobacter TaxID=2623496 RepID=UPI001F1875CD|nr:MULTISPECIES: flagellar basal body-associated FliL family protein [unclassified Xanthobacter]
MADENKEGNTGGGRRGLLIALAVLTLIAAITGAGIGYLLGNTVEASVSARIASSTSDKEGPPLRYSGDLTIKELKPLVVNLAAPSSTFVRVEAALVFKNGALANPDVTAAEVREDIMAYMRSLSLSQLEGPSALQQLREDLNDRASTRTEGKITELVLETLVVQ